FEAEDGIRDWSVTGVQTCALPISVAPLRRLAPRVDSMAKRRAAGRHGRDLMMLKTLAVVAAAAAIATGPAVAQDWPTRPITLVRSEERRVGKEWGWR